MRMNWEDFKDKLQRIEWREKMNENSGLISVAALAVTVLALGISAWVVLKPVARPHVPNTLFFYDTDSHETFALPANQIPPLLGTSGKPTLVRAYYYTCDGDCRNKKLFYLERYTEKAKAALEAVSTSNKDTPDAAMAQMQARNGLELRLPDGTDKDWVPAESTEGSKIYSSIRCPDASKQPVPCLGE